VTGRASGTCGPAGDRSKARRGRAARRSAPASCADVLVITPVASNGTRCSFTSRSSLTSRRPATVDALPAAACGSRGCGNRS
jgi:hypothetical protein